MPGQLGDTVAAELTSILAAADAGETPDWKCAVPSSPQLIPNGPRRSLVPIIIAVLVGTAVGAVFPAAIAHFGPKNLAAMGREPPQRSQHVIASGQIGLTSLPLRPAEPLPPGPKAAAKPPLASVPAPQRAAHQGDMALLVRAEGGMAGERQIVQGPKPLRLGPSASGASKVDELAADCGGFAEAARTHCFNVQLAAASERLNQAYADAAATQPPAATLEAYRRAMAALRLQPSDNPAPILAASDRLIDELDELALRHQANQTAANISKPPA